MKLVSFSLSTQCSLPNTDKLASTHLIILSEIIALVEQEILTSCSKHQAAFQASHWVHQRAVASQQATMQGGPSPPGAGGQ